MARKEEQDDPADSQRQGLNTAAQVTMAIAATFVAFLAAWNLILIHKTFVQTRKAAGSTRDAVWAARRANKIAQDALNGADRPWVTLVGVTGANKIKVGQKADLTINIENLGKSPAKNVVDGVTVGLIPVANFPTTAAKIQNQLQNRGVLFPSESVLKEEPSPVAITKERMQAIREGTLALAVLGPITYEDSGGALHHSRVCWIWIPEIQVNGRADNWGSCQGFPYEAD
jgi:hypothetical protein